MASDDRVPSTEGTTTLATAPPPPFVKKTGNSTSRATEFLVENSKIQLYRSHYLKYRRYYKLKLQEMFDSLVELYSGIFKQYYHRFKRMAETYAIGQASGQNVTPWRNIAINYVSTWFLDLYVSIREAVMKISSLAFNEHYHHQRVYVSDVYDDYLIQLNAAIRPTHLQLIPEDTLAIPIFKEKKTSNDVIDWSNTNPFGIKGFSHELDFFYSTIEALKTEKSWKMSSITTNTLGTPAWLFDWHEGHVCAWFPADSNYTMDDVTIAYIVGVACTPNLGPLEYDEWQFFPGNVAVTAPIPSSYRWTSSRHTYGGFEVLDIDNQSGFKTTIYKKPTEADLEREAKRKKVLTIGSGQQSEPSAEEVPEYVTEEVATPRFRLKMWIYYHQVFTNVDPHTRTGAHRIISFQ
ncbi:putative CP [Alloteropsis cryptic virus 1]|nr:putative CP [Alloteropsis cryptic virus 1]